MNSPNQHQYSKYLLDSNSLIPKKEESLGPKSAHWNNIADSLSDDLQYEILKQCRKDSEDKFSRKAAEKLLCGIHMCRDVDTYVEEISCDTELQEIIFKTVINSLSQKPIENDLKLIEDKIKSISDDMHKQVIELLRKKPYLLNAKNYEFIAIL